MSSLPALSSIDNGTTADAAEVDGNFDILATFVDGELINRDGSITMTGELTLSSSTPSGDLVAASRGFVKATDSTALTAKFTRSTDIVVAASGTGSVTFEAETADTDGWWSSGTTFTCPADGVYAIALRVEATGAGLATDLQASLSFDGSQGGLFGASLSLRGSGPKRGTGGSIACMEFGDQVFVSYTEIGGSAGSTITDVVMTITRIALL